MSFKKGKEKFSEVFFFLNLAFKAGLDFNTIKKLLAVSEVIIIPAFKNGKGRT